MIFFYSTLLFWNGSGILSNLMRNQGNWSFILILHIIGAGISLNGLLYEYKHM